MKPPFNPLLIASTAIFTGVVQAADYNWGNC